MEEWKKCKIGDLVEIHRGASPRPIQNYISTSGMPWVKISDATSNNSRFITSTKEFIIEDGIKNSVVVNPEDLIVSNSATPGLPKIMKIQACIHDGWLYFSDYKNITRDFLYYKFFDIQKHLNNLANGSVFQNLKTDIVKNFDINLPPLPTQQKIAAILSSLDDKIELNNKINTNLEHQAQALFKSFSEKASESGKFTDLIDILGGGTPKTNNEDFWNGNIPFFTPKDVGNPYCLTTEKTITENGLNNCNSKLYPVNTIFVTARGTVGKVSLAGVPMAMNQSCYALKSKDNNQLLAYYYTLEAISSLKHKANGATFDAIVTRDFETETISVLSQSDSEKFTQFAESVYKQILVNQKENLQLAQLRDTLLPKLMSGEIEV